RAIEVGPFPFDFHIRLVEPPAPSHGALPAPELLFQLRCVFEDPAVKRGMIHGHTPLPHHLLELPIRNRIGHIPPDAPQDDVPLKLASLEVDHAAAPPPLDQWRSIAKCPRGENLRQWVMNRWFTTNDENRGVLCFFIPAPSEAERLKGSGATQARATV